MSETGAASAASKLDHEVLILGAGFGGIGVGVELRGAGIDDFLVLDSTAVESAEWDDDDHLWQVRRDSDAIVTARFLIGAGGVHAARRWIPFGDRTVAVPPMVANAIVDVPLLRRALRAVLAAPLPLTTGSRSTPDYAVRGRDGADLAAVLSRSDYGDHRGIAIPEFPNLFFVTGPAGYSGRAAVEVIATAKAQGATAVEIISDDPAEYRYWATEPAADKPAAADPEHTPEPEAAQEKSTEPAVDLPAAAVAPAAPEPESAPATEEETTTQTPAASAPPAPAPAKKAAPKKTPAKKAAPAAKKAPAKTTVAKAAPPAKAAPGAKKTPAKAAPAAKKAPAKAAPAAKKTTAKAAPAAKKTAAKKASPAKKAPAKKAAPPKASGDTE